MPELPEVETTVRQIRKVAAGLKIVDVWTDYDSRFHRGKKNIKDRKFFEKFRSAVVGKRILTTSRRGKHILIHLSGDITMLVHMKMTGHFLYGKYVLTKNGWVPELKDGPLRDPYNRFIRLVFTLSNSRHLAFCDLRKFAKITFFQDHEKDSVTDLSLLGPDPLHPRFTFKDFKKALHRRPQGKIKQVLLDQTIIAGIGNIYGDETLFEVGVHPEECVEAISPPTLKKMHTAMKKILLHSIRIGGDSASDFRTIDGSKGGFQNKHRAYRKTGQKCSKRGCSGTIVRITVGGRGTHFCNTHQHRIAQR